MPMWNHAWSAGNWLLMALVMTLFWSAVVLGVSWWIREDRKGRPVGPDGSAAQQILDERLASGELTPEEFNERRNQLTGR